MTTSYEEIIYTLFLYQILQLLLLLYGDLTSFASYIICIFLALVLYFVVAKAVAEDKLLNETDADFRRLKKENAEQWKELNKNMRKIGHELAAFS